jgi:hypothetical protein
VAQGSFVNVSWDPNRFVGIDPRLVVDELTIQQLASCGGGFCQFLHPLLAPLLETYLPRPAGLTADAFYSCLSCYADRIDLTAWNDAAFARDLDERIVQPAVHAEQLLRNQPYLTRMYTTISPAEMTADPEFIVRGDLANVSLPTLATQRVLCDGRRVFTLPDGRQVALPQSGTWPEFPADMPWVETVEELPVEGDPIVLVDNRLRISSGLDAHNEAQGWDVQTSRGCGCGVPRRTSSAPLALGLLITAGFFARAQRRRARLTKT